MFKSKKAGNSNGGCLSTCLTRLMLLASVLGIIGVIALIAKLADDDRINIDLTPQRSAYGAVIVLPPQEDQPSDLLLMTTKSGSPGYVLTYLDRADLDIRWDRPLDDDNPAHMTLSTDSIYLVDEQNHLIALTLENGDQRWETDLLAGIAPGCEECVRALGEVVVVLTLDGMLQGFRAENGEMIWQVALNSVPLKLSVVNQRPAVVDNVPDATGQALILFDPLTGDIVQQIEPRCSTDEGDETLGSNSPILYDPLEQAVYFLFGSTRRGCAQRWNAITGKQVWQSSVDLDAVNWPRGRFDSAPLLENGVIYAAGNDTIFTINTKTGDIHLTAYHQDYIFKPLAADDDILVSHAVRTPDSARDELWGLDAIRGERLWRYEIEAESDGWTAQIVPAGLMVIQVLSGPDRIKVNILDFNTGETIIETTAEVDWAYWSGITWGPDLAWLTLQNLYTVDLSTGAISQFWPVPEEDVQQGSN